MTAVGVTGGTHVRQTLTWSRDGTATPSAGLLRWYNRTGGARTVVGVWVSAATPPTGQPLVVDLNKNGVTMFTTQANRAQVPVGANVGTTAVPDVVTIADGEYLTVDVDQVGSVAAGADVVAGILHQ